MRKEAYVGVRLYLTSEVNTLTPSLIDDPERLRRLKEARNTAEYAQHHIDDLRDLDARFLVMVGDSVIGKGETPEEAWADASGASAVSEALLIRIPKQDETFLF